ncbi:MAG TPA: Gfo/Idh/MocA family oxidoreductase [Motilibacterales bacterium]|nr:Gfo/Idh/MocA family oxidoreductase [Motilibacterales bacterium]
MTRTHPAAPADPRSAPALRWGVLGAGGIASVFTEAVTQHTESRMVAVGSRDQDRAEEFASRHSIPAAHGSYEALVTDPDVEVVYVASPHSEHLEHALLAIAAGKHVLVEKAFTVNATEAQQVFDAARAAGVFVMEAMWTRFLPHVVVMRDVLARREIGDLVGVIADHGQNMGHHPATHRLHDLALAGGALLDLGVYPVSFSHDLFGVPDRVSAIGALTETGVDGQVSIALGFSERQASLHTTLHANTATTAVVFGTHGRMEIEGRFYAPTRFRVVRDDGTHWTFDGTVDAGMQYEAAEVARCVSAGLPESPLMTWQGTLEVMRTMDEVRRRIGLVYPSEAAR